MSVASWCCKSFCVVPCVSFCTGHFVMVPLNITYLHCLQHSLFEHLFNLFYVKICLYLEFYFKISIDQSGYLAYNSYRPTDLLLDSGFGLIDFFADLFNTYILFVILRIFIRRISSKLIRRNCLLMQKSSLKMDKGMFWCNW